MPSVPRGKRLLNIRQSLEALSINHPDVFAYASSRDEEFRIIKKTYFRAALHHHPDKGGDPATFREIHTAFELLRDLHNGKQRRRGRQEDWLFSSCLAPKNVAPKKSAKSKKQQDEGDEAFDMSSYDQDFSNMATPSWEFYQEAGESLDPPYRIELAKSNRSKCTRTGKYKKCTEPFEAQTEEQAEALVDMGKPVELISKGEVRIGWLNEQAGSYGGWCHLRCWRVPRAVWLGLPDPDDCTNQRRRRSYAAALASMNEVALSGFQELPQKDQEVVAAFVMDKAHWARGAPRPKGASSRNKRGAHTAEADIPATKPASKPAASVFATLQSTMASASTAIVKAKRQRFVIPVPGRNGAVRGCLSGKTFVLTGVFPEVGGGSGLNLGKAKVKAMIESFGGRVTGSVSGKTDALVVGKDPGFSKVSKARGRDRCTLVGLKDLKDGLDGGCRCLEDFPVWNDEQEMLIQNFSTGYRNNGLALGASGADLAIAQGLVAKKKKRDFLRFEDDRKPAAKTTKKWKAPSKATQKASTVNSKSVAATKASSSLLSVEEVKQEAKKKKTKGSAASKPKASMKRKAGTNKIASRKKRSKVVPLEETTKSDALVVVASGENQRLRRSARLRS